MKLARFIGLFALSYFVLIFTYIGVATIIAFYEWAPEANRVAVLGEIVRDSSLSIFRDSARWLVGPEGLYNFVPTLHLINSVDVFRGLVPHGVVQIGAFGFLGFFAASRGCSLAMALLLPVCLLGLTMSLLQGRLLLLAQYNLSAVVVVVGLQVIGLFLGSTFYTMRLK